MKKQPYLRNAKKPQTVKKQRRLQILKELSDLSRNGWANARPCDYQPLEDELNEPLDA